MASSKVQSEDQNEKAKAVDVILVIGVRQVDCEPRANKESGTSFKQIQLSPPNNGRMKIHIKYLKKLQGIVNLRNDWIIERLTDCC